MGLGRCSERIKRFLTKILLTMKIIAVVLLASCTLIFGCAQTSKETNSSEFPVTPVKIISNEATVGSGEPNLFTDPMGNVYLSWVEEVNGSSKLKFSKYENEAWSVPQLIAEGDDWFVNWADFPLLTGDGDGNMAAHFLAKTDVGTYAYGIYMVFSNDFGKTWSEPMVPHELETPTEHGFVSMVPWNNGYVAVWLDGRNTGLDGGAMTLRSAFLDFNGKISQEFELDNRICDCCQTSAVLTEIGPVAVYRDRSESEIRDMSIVRWENGKWTPPALIHNDNWNISGCPVNGPEVASEGNRLAIAWYTAADGKSKINFAYSSNGGKNIDDPVRIDDGKPIGRVDIVMLEDGSSVVCWVEDTGLGGEIRVKQINSQGEEIRAFVLAKTELARSSGFPRMTRSGDQVYFAWRDVSDDQSPVIRTATYDL